MSVSVHDALIHVVRLVAEHLKALVHGESASAKA